MNTFLKNMLLAFLLIFSLAAGAAEPIPEKKGFACPKANVFGKAIFQDVCWSCMLPIHWGSQSLGGGDSPKPADASAGYTCTCDSSESNAAVGVLGLSLGFWQPTRIIESVRTPYCFPSLGGVQAGDAGISSSKFNFGTLGNIKTGEQTSDDSMRTHIHLFAYPLLQILQMMDVPTCVADYYKTFDLLYMSETFPNFNDDLTAFLTNPEAILFGNPMALSAQVLDCASIGSTGSNIDSAFWVAGCWGGMYPLTGGTTGTGSHQVHSSLVSTRFLYMLARLGFVRRTVGDDAICEHKYMPMLKKSQYRFQQLWPMPEADSKKVVTTSPDTTDTPPTSDPHPGETAVKEVDLSALQKGCCHALGASTFTWGEWRTVPGVAEDKVYLVWQYVECCVGMIGI